MKNLCCKTIDKIKSIAVFAFAMGMFVNVSLGAEPVWPADFSEKLAANRAAAMPGELQSASAGEGLLAGAIRKCDEILCAIMSLRTKKFEGLTIIVK
jgi:hypothetical protein